jgi:integral membrane sensor domain MASE1
VPGLAVLLAFLLAVPFARGWSRVTEFQRDVFVVAFLATAVSIALFTAPTSYHRLRFRQGNKEHLLKVGNHLAIAGIAVSAVALDAVVLLVMDYVLWLGAAIAAAVSFLAVIAWLWYVPLWSAVRDRPAR